MVKTLPVWYIDFDHTQDIPWFLHIFNSSLLYKFFKHKSFLRRTTLIHIFVATTFTYVILICVGEIYVLTSRNSLVMEKDLRSILIVLLFKWCSFTYCCCILNLYLPLILFSCLLLHVEFHFIITTIGLSPFTKAN